MRKAFTLPELVLVLAVAGIFLSLGLPQFTRALDRIEVASVSAHIVAAHRRARIMAITRSQILTLTISPTELAIYQRGGATPLWSEIGPAATGVTLAGAKRQVTFSPEGITLGVSNTTLQLARGASTRTIVISRLGRVRIVH
jgi:prepilin-type N-terminal cleavage/methylation domain-containing protein